VAHVLASPQRRFLSSLRAQFGLSTGNPEDLGEQMMKIGARLALMAKRYPEMAQAMLEELQDQ
jgi:hypothetical protein